ncbi:Caax amino terminal protease, partial [Thalictrum thalictroides]
MAASALITSSSIQSSHLSFSSISKLTITSKPNHAFLLKKPTSSFPLRFPLHQQSNNFFGFSIFHKQQLSFLCFNNPKDESNGSLQTKETGLDWPIFKRWDVPWSWQTVSLTFFACGI